MDVEYHTGYIFFMLIITSPLLLAYTHAFHLDLPTLRHYYLYRVIPAVIVQSWFPIHWIVSLLFIALHAVVKLVSGQTSPVLVHVHRQSCLWMEGINDWFVQNGEIIQRWWDEKVWSAVRGVIERRVIEPMWALHLRSKEASKKAAHARRLKLLREIENPPSYVFLLVLRAELRLLNARLELDETNGQLDKYLNTLNENMSGSAASTVGRLQRWLTS